MKLYIGNKNYSSWSMRPWLVLKHFQLPFDEVMVPFDDFQPEQAFKTTMSQISPTAKVPALVDERIYVWDSLAICEYLAERYPEQEIWPHDLKQRARARSLCAEMHSGFQALRRLCSMNIQANLRQTGNQLWQDHALLRTDVERIEAIWKERPSQDSFLCGHTFSVVDAFFTPVVMRLITYGLPVSVQAEQYIQTILQVPAVKLWIEDAKHSIWFN